MICPISDIPVDDSNSYTCPKCKNTIEIIAFLRNQDELCPMCKVSTPIQDIILRYTGNFDEPVMSYLRASVIRSIMNNKNNLQRINIIKESFKAMMELIDAERPANVAILLCFEKPLTDEVFNIFRRMIGFNENNILKMTTYKKTKKLEKYAATISKLWVFSKGTNRKSEPVFMCSGKRCFGILWDGVCTSCKKTVCEICEEMRGEEHECDPDVLATLETIKESCVKCPGCKAYVQKSYGCNMMFCTKCYTKFNYESGKIHVADYFHNPEHEDHMRSSRNAPVVSSLVAKIFKYRPTIYDSETEVFMYIITKNIVHVIRIIESLFFGAIIERTENLIHMYNDRKYTDLEAIIAFGGIAKKFPTILNKQYRSIISRITSSQIPIKRVPYQTYSIGEDQPRMIIFSNPMIFAWNSTSMFPPISFSEEEPSINIKEETFKKLKKVPENTLALVREHFGFITEVPKHFENDMKPNCEPDRELPLIAYDVTTSKSVKIEVPLRGELLYYIEPTKNFLAY